MEGGYVDFSGERMIFRGNGLMVTLGGTGNSHKVFIWRFPEIRVPFWRMFLAEAPTLKYLKSGESKNNDSVQGLSCKVQILAESELLPEKEKSNALTATSTQHT